MSTPDEQIASLSARLDAELGNLKQQLNTLSTKTPQDPRVAQLTQQLQQVANWQATLRGTQGVTVRGNVIEGPPQNAGSSGTAGGGTGGLLTLIVAEIGTGNGFYATFDATLGPAI